MWMTRDTAFSDVVLAPAGVVLGTGAIGLLALVPGWPGGIVGQVVVLVAAVVVMVGWPTWLARQRGETGAVGSRLQAGDLALGVAVAAPTVAVGIVSGLLQGLPLSRALFGQLANLPPSLSGLLRIALVVVMAVGTFLVLVLVGRRAPQAFEGIEMSVTAGLRSYGLGLAAAATVLYGLYAFDTGRPILLGLVAGAGLAATVLLVDAQVPVGLTAPRGAILAAAVVAALLWVLRGGLFLFGGDLLPRLALASVAATLALCIGVLVLAHRTWAAALLPLASAVWLVSILPVIG